jgi:hypothetical protein
MIYIGIGKAVAFEDERTKELLREPNKPSVFNSWRLFSMGEQIKEITSFKNDDLRDEEQRQTVRKEFLSPRKGRTNYSCKGNVLAF